MSLPPLLAEAIATTGLPEPFASARFATVDDHPCEGAKFHSPQPLVVRQVALGDSGATAWLCSTCADNLLLLQWITVQHYGSPPWPARREFGNGIRRLVAKGQEVSHGE